MGELVATENFGLRIESTLGQAVRRDTVGAEAGMEFHFRPVPDCEKSHFYSNQSPLVPSPRKYHEYISCRPYTYWALMLSAGGIHESGRGEGSATAYGFNGGLGLFFNWTRPEKVFKTQLDGSDSKTYHPLSLGIGPVGQYSSLQGWRGGLGAGVQIADYFYLNGGVLWNGDGLPAEYFTLGLRDLF